MKLFGSLKNILNSQKKQEKNQPLLITQAVDLLNLEIKRINEKKDYKKMSESLLIDYLEVRKSLELLQKAKKNEDIDKRLESSANHMRNHFTNVLLPCVNEDITPPINLEQLNEVMNRINRILESSKVVDTNKGVIINAVYGREMNELGSSVKKLVFEFDKIKEITQKDNLEIDSKKSILNQLKELADLLSAYVKIKKQEENSQNKQNELTDNLKTISCRIKSLEEQENYQEIQSKIMLLEEKKRRVQEINEKIENETSVLNRVIKKYIYEKKDEEKSIELLASKSNFIFKEEFIPNLTEIKRLIQTDKMNLKQKEKDKTINLIDRILSNEFNGLTEKITELEIQIPEIKKEIETNSLINEKKELDKKIERIFDEINSCKKELININADKQKIKSRIDDKKSKIEKNFNKVLSID